jgi:hypothetical protein
MATRNELETLATGLEDLLGRVTSIVEREGTTSGVQDDGLELVAIERGLASTLRRLRRVIAQARA